MSVDILSIGRHNLDVSSVESASRQISERLDINIAIGDWDVGVFIPQQLIERHPGVPFYRMWDISSKYEPVQYDLTAPEEYTESEEGVIHGLTVSLETVYISFRAVTWRWQWYWRLFGDEDYDRDSYSSCLEDIQAFRKVAKDYYHRLGSEYIYCYADQGPSDLIGEYEDGTWEAFENVIRTGKYLDCDIIRKEWPEFTAKDLRIINVSDFLLGKTKEPSHSWWDVFYDDFADLKN